MVGLGGDAVEGDRVIYINRLSDLLFTMARAANARAGRRRSRVVTEPRTPRASAWRGSTTRTFPVASRLLPPASRPHIAAVYAFARMADDFADEGDTLPRSAARPTRRLARAVAPRPPDGRVVAATTTPMRRRSSPRSPRPCVAPARRVACSTICSAPFARTSRRRDTRPGTIARLLPAIRESHRTARPRGHRISRSDPSTRVRTRCARRCSSRISGQTSSATGPRGALYVPLGIVRAAGADEPDLDARRLTPAWQAALRDAAGRTRRLFLDGRAVADGVTGRLGRGNCGPRGLAGCASWIGWRRPASTCSASVLLSE